MASREVLKGLGGFTLFMGGLGVASLAGALAGGEVAHFAMYHNFINPDYFFQKPVTAYPEFHAQLIGAGLGMSGYVGGIAFLSSRRKS